MDSKDTPTTSTSKTTATTTTTSELESEEISVETSVPTDLTLSPESDFERRKPFQGNLITRQLLERKQLLHDLQLVKIELSQKTLVIDNLKADFMARTEELEEKLADAVHQKQLLQARLEMQLQIQQEDARTRMEQTRLELEVILMKQQELEEINSRLQDRSDEVRRSLRNLELDKEQYNLLRMQDSNQLSLRDYVAVKVYDMIWNYKTDLERAMTQLNLCNEENRLLKNANKDLKEESETQKLRAEDSQIKYNNVLAQFNDVKSQMRTSDFKIENYDKVKSERDDLFKQLLNTKTELSNTQAVDTALKKELEDVKSERTALQQKSSLLQQDKDFLDKRVMELTSRCKALEDHLAKTSLQLDRMTQAREDLYEKYVTSRDLYKSEFERKLQEELENLQTRTASEIEMLKKVSREMHEQEIRSLKDSRDLAISQRDKAEATERQVMSRYENLLEELRQSQSSSTVQLSNLKSQLLLKTYELEQLRMVHGETQKNVMERNLDNEKLQKKVEILNKEIQDTDQQLKLKINELNGQLKEKSSKLAVYEKLEHELDDVIMKAAEVSNPNEGKNLALTLGSALGVPTTTQRRLQHSFHLAKQILFLEKQNQILKENLEKEKKLVKLYLQELEDTKELLDLANKPNSFLVDLIKQKDQQIRDQNTRLDHLNEEISGLKNAKKLLEMKLQVLTKDIEKLMKNREEIEKMKQVLLSAFPDHFEQTKAINEMKPQIDGQPIRTREKS